MEALGERGQAGYNHRSESVDGDRSHSQFWWQFVRGHDKPPRRSWEWRCAIDPFQVVVLSGEQFDP